VCPGVPLACPMQGRGVAGSCRNSHHFDLVSELSDPGSAYGVFQTGAPRPDAPAPDWAVETPPTLIRLVTVDVSPYQGVVLQDEIRDLPELAQLRVLQGGFTVEFVPEERSVGVSKSSGHQCGGRLSPAHHGADTAGEGNVIVPLVRPVAPGTEDHVYPCVVVSVGVVIAVREVHGARCTVGIDEVPRPLNGGIATVALELASLAVGAKGQQHAGQHARCGDRDLHELQEQPLNKAA